MKVLTPRVAVIGSGPAGFFTVANLLRSTDARIDLFDRLPVPYGLVRFGVAPDHQHTKRVAAVFDRIGSDARVRFIGNIELGRDITVGELDQHYHAVVVATGAEEDRRLPLPDPAPAGIHSALEFIGAINGHPDFQTRNLDLSCEQAVIVGNGNVALDLARLLLTPAEELARTDITDRARAWFHESRIKTVTVLGRRGPLQASFTFPELDELTRQEHFEVISTAQPAGPRPAFTDVQRILTGLPEHSQHMRTLDFQFYRSVIATRGTDQLEAVEIQDNKNKNAPAECLPCGLLLQAIGHRGAAIEGLPFDPEKGLIPTVDHRILDGNSLRPGWYACGWIEQGARGLIGHNKPRAKETVEMLAEDLPGLLEKPLEPADSLSELLRRRGLRPVSWSEWKKIEAEENSRGAAQGRPRRKFTSVGEILDWLG